MKKVICFIIMIAIIFTSTETAYAKKQDKCNDKHTITYEAKNDYEDGRQEIEIDEWTIIKYGKYWIPVEPITNGMGAKITYDKSRAMLTIVKDITTIVFKFKEKTVYVNGVQDKKSGIYTARSSMKMFVILEYIAKKLGFWFDYDDDEIIIEVPGLTPPKNVTLNPVGAGVIPNTLNSMTNYMTASAIITPGQAAGGKAELYVGNRLIATDPYISATDNLVLFTTSDESSTNAELQKIIPSGGVVTVRLYNSSYSSVTSAMGNPTLVVDYSVPTITGITSANYNALTNQLRLNVTGAGAVGDKIDVTKLAMYDAYYGKVFQLTNNSTGAVTGTNSIDITIGAVDKLGLSGFGSTSLYLTVAAGSLLKDAVGNLSTPLASGLTVPVNSSTIIVTPTPVPNALDLPTNVTVIAAGGNVTPNSLNSTNLYLTASARITAGQATGGRAELYVGNKLVAVDNQIAAADTSVTFTTSDGTPTNVELQSLIPTGGTVTVKLINAMNTSTISTTGNPVLVVDYIAPTIGSITSVIYNIPANQLYLIVSNAGTVGDKVDVTKIALSDTYLGKYYQLTGNPATGSSGTVSSATSIMITLGITDRLNLMGFGTSAVNANVLAGALLMDNAGNTSNVFTGNLGFGVVVIK